MIKIGFNKYFLIDNKMGFSVQASETTQTLNDFTSVINTAVENARNDAKLNCTAVDNISVLSGSVPVFTNGVVTGAIVCPTNATGVTITQTANATCNLSGDFTTDFQNSLSTSVQNNVQQWIDTELKNKQGWLSIAFSAQIAKNENSTTIATRITNGLTANITTQCSAQLLASANAIVSICGNYTADFNFDQSAFTTNLTSCIAKNVGKSVV